MINKILALTDTKLSVKPRESFWKCISFNEKLCSKKMIYHSTLGIQMHI